MERFIYRAELLKVVDGDTVDLLIDCGFGITYQIRVRILGINAPETYGVKKGSEEYVEGMKAKAWLEKALGYHGHITIRTHKDRKGKYGRYLAELFVTLEPNEGQINVGEKMIALGLAKRYGE